MDTGHPPWVHHRPAQPQRWIAVVWCSREARTLRANTGLTALLPSKSFHTAQYSVGAGTTLCQIRKLRLKLGYNLAGQTASTKFSIYGSSWDIACASTNLGIPVSPAPVSTTHLLGQLHSFSTIPWWRSRVSVSPVSWTLGSVLSFIFTALSEMGPQVPRVVLPCPSLQPPQARDLSFQMNLHLCKLEPLMGGVFPSRHFPSCPLVKSILAFTSGSVYQLRMLCPPCTPPTASFFDFSRIHTPFPH